MEDIPKRNGEQHNFLFESAYPCDIDGDSIPDSSVSVPEIDVRASVKVMTSVATEPTEMTII